MTEYRLEDLLPEGVALDAIKRMLVEVDRKIAESVVNYKFVAQMVGDNQQFPSGDVLTLIIAQRYAEFLRTWDGEDMYIPFLFARLTSNAVTK